jgi:hypothetical protein
MFPSGKLDGVPAKVLNQLVPIRLTEKVSEIFFYTMDKANLEDRRSLLDEVMLVRVGLVAFVLLLVVPWSGVVVVFACTC